MRVTTFNIRNDRSLGDGKNIWWFRRRLVLSAINDIGADVIALQEARPRQMHYLRRHLDTYECAATGRDDGRNRGEHCPIFVGGALKLRRHETRWFSDTPLIAGSKFTGASHPRICTIAELEVAELEVAGTGPAFVVANVHLDATNAALRKQSLVLLRQWAQSSDSPWVIVGDFNCGIDAPEMYELLDHGWKDALAPLPPNGPHAATFHGFQGHSDGLRIDHILGPDGFEVPSSHIWRSGSGGRPASDHWPVVADLAGIVTGGG